MLSIGERRAIMSRAYLPDFRDLMLTDPRGAVKEATGRILAEDQQVEVVHEGNAGWSFILVDPADIAELPAPDDARSAVENDVYRFLRDNPDAVDAAVADPVTFLRERFGVEVNGVDLRREGKSEILLVLPNVGAREELSEDMLDLVAGGGDSGCQSGRLTHKYDIEGESQ